MQRVRRREIVKSVLPYPRPLDVAFAAHELEQLVEIRSERAVVVLAASGQCVLYADRDVARFEVANDAIEAEMRIDDLDGRVVGSEGEWA